MLDQSYGALKSVRRSIKVIGGNTWTVGDGLAAEVRALDEAAQRQAPRMDWFGHNPFSVRSPRLSRRPYAGGVRDISDIDTLHKEIKRYYRKRTPKLWMSEFTVSSRRANRAFTFFVSEATQARWLRDAFRIACRKRYVAGLGWFTLLDEPEAPGSLTFGLLYPDGRPKPAYFAYRNAC